MEFSTPSNNRMYTLTSTGYQIVEGSTETVVGSLAASDAGYPAAFNPTRNRFYGSSDATPQVIYVFDGTSNALIGTISAPPGYTFNIGLLDINSSNGKLYASATDSSGNLYLLVLNDGLVTTQHATSVSVAPDSAASGGSANLQATLTRVSDGSGVSAETISFTLNGNAVGSATTDISGVASLNSVSLAGITPGTYATGIGASFAGDANLAASTGTGQLVVTAAGQTIGFGALVNKTFGDSDFTVSASASSGLAVSFTVGATDQCIIAGATVHLAGAGSCTVTAHQPGNASYSAAPDVAQSFGIFKAVATVTLGSLNQTYDGNAKSATATTSPAGLTVTFTYNASATAPANAGSYAVLGTISNNNYQGSATATLTINQVPLTITANNVSRPFGSPNPALVASYSGFVGGQGPSSLTGPLSCTTTAISGNGSASPGSPLGNYPITCLGQSSTNYHITYVPGTLTVTPAPLVMATPTSLTFPPQRVGTSSANQNVILTNSGTSILSITSIAATGDFSQTNGCPVNLRIGASCTIHVTFKPTANGARNGTILVTDNASDSPQTVSLTGAGGVATIALSAANLSFSDQLVGTTSARQSVTLINSGTVTLTSLTVAANGDFTRTTTCGGSLAPGVNCAIDVGLRPTVIGNRTGSVVVSGNADNSPQTITLSGNGINPVASLSPGSLSFGNQLLGTTGAAKTITVANQGTTPLAITSVTANGDFTQTTNCPISPATLAPALSCAISVTFGPTATGGRTGKVTVTDNAAGSPHTANLSGNGINPVVLLSATSLTFGNQAVGTTSAAQVVTLANTGTTALTITSTVASGDFTRTQTCGGSVAAGAGCTISIKFKPSAIGARAGAITITDNAGTNPQVISLSGSGK